MNVHLQWFLVSFILGVTCTSGLLLMLVELRWRDPIFRGLHKRIF